MDVLSSGVGALTKQQRTTAINPDAVEVALAASGDASAFEYQIKPGCQETDQWRTIVPDRHGSHTLLLQTMLLFDHLAVLFSPHGDTLAFLRNHTSPD